MKIFTIIVLFFSGGDTLALTPTVVDSLVMRNYMVLSEQYSHNITQNEFHRSLLALFFVPRLSVIKTKTGNELPFYEEYGEVKVNVFSPSKVASLMQNFWAYKESGVKLEQVYRSQYLQVLDAIFFYEYLKEKLQADSLMVEYAGKIYELTREKLKIGLVDSIELLSALDNLEDIKLKFLEDKNALFEKELEIKAALNIENPFIIVLDSFKIQEQKGVDYKKSYNVLMAKQERKSAITGEVVSLLSILPEVSVAYKKSYSGSVFGKNLREFRYTRSWRIYFVFYPFDFVFNMKRARLQSRKASISLKNTEMKEKERFVALRHRLDFLKTRESVLRLRLGLKEKRFNLMLEKYSIGELPLHDIIKEQADYINVMADYLKTRLDRIKYTCELNFYYGG